MTSFDDVVTMFSRNVIQTLRQPPAVAVQVDRPETALEAEPARPDLLGQVGRRRRDGEPSLKQVRRTAEARRRISTTQTAADV